MVRALVAASLLFVGAVFIYGVGAGYIVQIPTPLNLVASVVHGLVLLWIVYRVALPKRGD